jgi:hypothetical protein
VSLVFDARSVKVRQRPDRVSVAEAFRARQDRRAGLREEISLNRINAAVVVQREFLAERNKLMLAHRSVHQVKYSQGYFINLVEGCSVCSTILDLDRERRLVYVRIRTLRRKLLGPLYTHPYVCDRCSKRYTSNFGLQKHVSRLHAP